MREAFFVYVTSSLHTKIKTKIVTNVGMTNAIIIVTINFLYIGCQAKVKSSSDISYSLLNKGLYIILTFYIPFTTNMAKKKVHLNIKGKNKNVKKYVFFWFSLMSH